MKDNNRLFYFFLGLLILLYLVDFFLIENFSLIDKVLRYLGLFLILLSMLWRSNIIIIECFIWFLMILLFKTYFRIIDPEITGILNFKYNKEIYYLDIINLIIRVFIISYLVFNFSKIKTLVFIVSMVVLFYLKVEYFPV